MLALSLLVTALVPALSLVSPPTRGAPPRGGRALAMYDGLGSRGYRGGRDRFGDPGPAGDAYRFRDSYPDGYNGYRGDADRRFGPGGPELGDERAESVKACAITGIVGTTVASPLVVNFLAKGGSAPLQFAFLFVACSLFGAVYRCAARSDNSFALQWGAVAAFTIIRALATLPPGMNHWTPVIQSDFLGQLWIGAAAFGHAAWAYESAVDSGFAFPLEGYSRALDRQLREFRKYERDGYYESGGGYGGGLPGNGYNDGYNNYDSVRDRRGLPEERYGNGYNNYGSVSDGRYNGGGGFYANRRGDRVGAGVSRGGSYGEYGGNRPPL